MRCLILVCWVSVAVFFAACQSARVVESPAATVASPDESPILGNRDARVTMTEYFDFQCEHCKRTLPVFDALLKAYPQDLRIVSKPYMRAYTQTREQMLAHPSFRAAAAALAAERQGRYAEMMHVLFENQLSLSEADLAAYAQTAGLDVDRFNRDRTDPAVLALVEGNGKEAGRLDIANTPAIEMNGKTYQGGRDFDFYSGLVAAALGRPPAPAASSGAPLTKSAPVTWNDMIFAVSPLEPVTAKPVLKVGDTAPDFTLPGACGQTFELSKFRGKQNVVISFVPAAFTPVCSGQFPHYISQKAEFDALDTIVLGITADNIPSLWAWTRGMEGLNFPVLSDFWPHGATAKKYGVLRPESGTTERALFLVDKKGIVRYIDVHDINSEPDMEPLMAALRSVAQEK